jgi:hypothetical protein
MFGGLNPLTPGIIICAYDTFDLLQLPVCYEGHVPCGTQCLPAESIHAKCAQANPHTFFPEDSELLSLLWIATLKNLASPNFGATPLQDF